MKRSLLLCVLTLAATWLWKAPATADDVQLLPPNLMAPTSKDTIPAGKFKKDHPGQSACPGPASATPGSCRPSRRSNTPARTNPNIKEFRFVEANWQPAKQVADIEDLMAHKVDALIIVPISPEVVKAQVDAAAKAGIPVIVFSPSSAPSPDATVSDLRRRRGVRQPGGEFLKDRLHGKGIDLGVPRHRRRPARTPRATTAS